VTRHQATIHAFAPALADQPGDRLTFAEPPGDRVAAYFHTGGTTGLPKMAQHRHSGVIFNAWLGGTLMYRDDDVLLCPLPLFHVFGAYPVTLAAAFNGAHVVYPTPAGYRGDGVLDNFWKLVERWRASFTIAVPTALAALMQRPIDADISTLRLAICGSAPLPLELYKRFERATGVTLVEGYGLTEATCLVACNPPEGVKKIGSVGLPLPYVHIRILRGKGEATHLCGVDEIGEICIASPGVSPGSVYTEEDKNHGLFAEDRFLRTGDLGRIDADGYLFITGRAKDLIIRGGHNIDPAEIEEALAGHPDVAMVGAVGQPDPFAGEMPCAYVELVAGAQATPEALMEHLRAHISERAAIPKHLEILPALPKTAIGKVFKPELRKLAIRRVYDETLAAAGLKARVAAVIEDERRGLVARLAHEGEDDPAAVSATLGAMTYQWEWARSE
jgi:fatty-acyl-CoA synthase